MESPGARNFRGPRKPNQPSWLERGTRELPDSITTTRRAFIRDSILVVASVAFAAKTVKNGYDYNTEAADTVQKVNANLSTRPNNERLEPGHLIPEDERFGDELITGLVPNYNPFPIFGGYDYKKDAINNGFVQFVSNLDRGTKISIMVPEGTIEECKSAIEEKFPGITFEYLELPRTHGGYNFASNIVFPTGEKDKSGRSIMVTSNADEMLYRQARSAYDLMYPEAEQKKTFWDKGLDYVFFNNRDNEEASAGMNLFADEFLTKSYPNKFVNKSVPVIANNGDIRVTRLPNGKVGLIVGKRSLSITVQALRLKRGYQIPTTASKQRDFDIIEPELFKSLMDEVENLYKQYFGVETVIFLDKPYIDDHIKRKAKIQQSAMQGYAFFDSDMIFNTSTDAQGKAVAFCTNYTNRERENRNEAGYTFRIADQLKELGYEIESLPCGPRPTMNYANAVIFTKGEKKVVMLPQYGIPQDIEAVKIYEKRGFEVRKIDMSFIKKLPPEQSSITGSVHCMFSVTH